jgi:hypothetical protein
MIGEISMLRTLALTSALAFAPLAASAQDAERLRLANQVIAVQGDMTDQVARTFNFPLPDSMPADQQKRLKAVIGQELLDHKADIQALVPQVAALWARTFTADELRQMVDYYGSPLGKAVVAKLVASGGGLAGPKNLTAPEAAAEQAFMTSEAGKALEAHRADIAVGSVTIIQPLMISMMGELQAKRCVVDDTCTKTP